MGMIVTYPLPWWVTAHYWRSCLLTGNTLLSSSIFQSLGPEYSSPRLTGKSCWGNSFLLSLEGHCRPQESSPVASGMPGPRGDSSPTWHTGSSSYSGTQSPTFPASCFWVIPGPGPPGTLCLPTRAPLWHRSFLLTVCNHWHRLQVGLLEGDTSTELVEAPVAQWVLR